MSSLPLAAMAPTPDSVLLPISTALSKIEAEVAPALAIASVPSAAAKSPKPPTESAFEPSPQAIAMSPGPETAVAALSVVGNRSSVDGDLEIQIVG